MKSCHVFNTWSCYAEETLGSGEWNTGRAVNLSKLEEYRYWKTPSFPPPSALTYKCRLWFVMKVRGKSHNCGKRQRCATSGHLHGELSPFPLLELSLKWMCPGSCSVADLTTVYIRNGKHQYCYSFLTFELTSTVIKIMARFSLCRSLRHTGACR